jgi:hypothetical protein
MLKKIAAYVPKALPYGYDYFPGTNLTAYEDSVHGAASIPWSGNVPAYVPFESNTLVRIMGGRGYVW